MKYYPKLKAAMSLQFIIRENGAMDFVATFQGGDLNRSAEFMIHGKNMANISNLNEKEKRAFRSFCESYLKQEDINRNYSKYRSERRSK